MQTSIGVSGSRHFGFGRAGISGEPANALHVTGVIVGDRVLPATKGDPDPLEGERTDGGVVVVPAAALLLIVGAGPVTEADGVSRPFVKRLAEKARTGPANVNPLGLAAAFGNGSNPAERLQIGGALIALSLRSESGQQARREGRPGTGKRIEDSEIGVRRHRLRDLPVDTVSE